MLDSLLSYYFLRQLDVFGTQITLNYKRDPQFRTSFGGGITVCCIFFIAVICFSTLNDLFQKTQVSFVQSTSYSVQPDSILFDSNQFMIAIQYDQPNFIKRPYVNITFQQSHFHRFINGTTVKNKTNIDLEPCTIDHFIGLPSYNQNWTYTFQLENLQDFLCLKKGTTFQIGGIFENEDFYYVKFSISKCINNTSNNSNKAWNPVCESHDVVAANQNQDSRIRFYISNNLLNPERAQNSISSYLDSALFNVQQGSMYTTANMYINSQTLITDESIFPISNVNTVNLMQYKVSETWQQYAIGNFDTFCDIYFRRSYYSTVIHKSYLKLAQVISYIGGFSQVFILISAFLVRKYNSYNLYLELANRLYDFDIPNLENTKENTHKTTIYNNSAIDSNINNNTNENNHQNTSQHVSVPKEQTKINLQNTSQEDKNNLQFPQLNQEVLLDLKNQQINPQISFQQLDENPKNLKDQQTGKEQQITQFVPLDQIRKVLMEKGIGKQYYQTDYFSENTESDQIQFSKQQNNIKNINLIQNQLKNNRLKTFQSKNNNNNLFVQNNNNKQNQQVINNFNQSINQNEDKPKENSPQKLEENNPQKLEENNPQKLEENFESQIGQKNEDLSFQSINQDFQMKNKTFPSSKFQSYKENTQNSIFIKDLSKIDKTQPENNILSQRSNFKYSYSSRKNLFESTDKNPQLQIKRVVSSFGASPNNKNMTKIVQEKYGGAVEQFLENKFKSIISRENKIWVDFKYFMNQLTCGKFFNSDHIKLINKAKNLVSEDLDIFNILDRQKEVEKMKKLFLNEDQQVLFNFFPKPIISIKSNQNQLSMKDLKQEQIDLQKSVSQVQKQSKKLNLTFKQTRTVAKAIIKFKKAKNSNISNYLKLFNHYLKLSQEQNQESNNIQTAINKKLIHLLGEEMRNIFEVAKKMQQKPTEIQQANQNNQQLLPSQYNQQSTKIENMFNTDQPLNTQNPHQIIQSSNFPQIQQQSSKLITFDSLFASSNNLKDCKQINLQKQLFPQQIEIQLQENNQIFEKNLNEKMLNEGKK
ncbi:transmembrane protein, putative (macronuclear) [Tetrahymena thermophila SB210]|uniref:Transmembrane protein, putative n=1 Tax=Tetrahymena thermophila (strain SB210) TaxID=312017 RepID=Q22SJ3_TETTS|nr:transmembrane protein, putative [Tetrahymena thermophila SB210]EAR87779.3 transmembrane protein, putative [Tetrahymena thermophila SB210]|eukprot:XP_001008024.3 transmembrane protein, putative [Tetrahymena thermophila SB210]